MKGADVVRLARRALVWAMALRRAEECRQALLELSAGQDAGAPALDEEPGRSRFRSAAASSAAIDELRSRFRSAAASAGGYRRGLVNDAERVRRSGVELPKLKNLPWEKAP